MDLLGIRKQFIEQSGRHDLVVDTTAYEDKGADYYINAAVRELDVEVFQTLGGPGVRYAVVEAGEYFVSLPDCRTIEIVQLSEGDKFRKLTYLPSADLRGLLQGSLSSVGLPRFYAPVNTRQVPKMSSFSAADETFIRDSAVVLESDYRGIAIAPPTELKAVIEVHGMFYSPALSENEDENFWTVSHPDILVKAAMRELERSYRNRQGAQDLSMFITEQLTKLDMDLAMDQAAKTDQMRG